MRKYLSYCLGTAACLAIAGSTISFAAIPLASHSNHYARSSAKDETADRESVRKTIADAADRVVSNGGLKNALEVISKTDRERLQKSLNQADEKAFEEKAAKFRAMWKEQFGNTFDAATNLKAFDKETISFREEGNRERADVDFPAEGDRTGFQMHFIREKHGDWRVELPDIVSGQAFARNMSESLNQLLADKSKLPKEETEAYQYVIPQLLHAMIFNHPAS